MPDNKRDQIKMYAIIGLLVVAMIVAYFRFVHKKTDSPVVVETAPEPLAQLEVPDVKIKTIKSDKKGELHRKKSFRPVIRDIFSPTKWPTEPKGPPPEPEPPKLTELQPKAEEPPPAEPEPPKTLPPPRVSGTIVGGKNPIAIIDGELYRIGDSIGEYKVVKITKHGILLDSGIEKVEVELVINE